MAERVTDAERGRFTEDAQFQRGAMKRVRKVDGRLVEEFLPLNAKQDDFSAISQGVEGVLSGVKSGFGSFVAAQGGTGAVTQVSGGYIDHMGRPQRGSPTPESKGSGFSSFMAAQGDVSVDDIAGENRELLGSDGESPLSAQELEDKQEASSERDRAQNQKLTPEQDESNAFGSPAGFDESQSPEERRDGPYGGQSAVGGKVRRSIGRHPVTDDVDWDKALEEAVRESEASAAPQKRVTASRVETFGVYDKTRFAIQDLETRDEPTLVSYVTDQIEKEQGPITDEEKSGVAALVSESMRWASTPRQAPTKQTTSSEFIQTTGLVQPVSSHTARRRTKKMASPVDRNVNQSDSMSFPDSTSRDVPSHDYVVNLPPEYFGDEGSEPVPGFSQEYPDQKPKNQEIMGGVKMSSSGTMDNITRVPDGALMDTYNRLVRKDDLSDIETSQLRKVTDELGLRGLVASKKTAERLNVGDQIEWDDVYGDKVGVVDAVNPDDSIKRFHVTFPQYETWLSDGVAASAINGGSLRKIGKKTAGYEDMWDSRDASNKMEIMSTVLQWDIDVISRIENLPSEEIKRVYPNAWNQIERAFQAFGITASRKSAQSGTDILQGKGKPSKDQFPGEENQARHDTVVGDGFLYGDDIALKDQIENREKEAKRVRAELITTLQTAQKFDLAGKHFEAGRYDQRALVLKAKLASLEIRRPLFKIGDKVELAGNYYTILGANKEKNLVVAKDVLGNLVNISPKIMKSAKKVADTLWFQRAPMTNTDWI